MIDNPALERPNVSLNVLESGQVGPLFHHVFASTGTILTAYSAAEFREQLMYEGRKLAEAFQECSRLLLDLELERSEEDRLDEKLWES